jgi:hypothetical protein
VARAALHDANDRLRHLIYSWRPTDLPLTSLGCVFADYWPFARRATVALIDSITVVLGTLAGLIIHEVPPTP